ncbi:MULTISPECIES: uridine kinase [unclassified Streptomyces]|uniref:uridine kinase family protein n=1 Tax=unclassified Streptomyces TaxID=2593676 RepID=UPI0036E567BE
MNDLSPIAARLRALAPSCGPVRLIAVDGHAGSGKSTFASRLAAALDDAPVLHLDDLATHDSFFGWVDLLREQVIGPLSRGEPARYAPYDWSARTLAAPRGLEPAPVVVIEGVGAGRRALRPYLARLLWMDLAAAESWERGRRRDGPTLSAFWDGWTEAEAEHFAADPSRPHADALVRQLPVGYEWLEGPGTTAAANHSVTERDQMGRRDEW